MRVLYDVEAFYSYPCGGIPIYAVELLKALTAEGPEVSFEACYATLRNASFNKIQSVANAHLPALALSRIPLPGRVARRSVALSSFLTRPKLKRPDVIHATSYVPQPYVGFPDAPLITTVHDVAFLRHKGRNFVPACDGTNETLVRAALKRAKAIIAVSKFTKRELCSLLDAPPEKIVVIYEGTQWEGVPAPSRIFVSDVLRRLSLTEGRYFLSVGTLSPRKNFGVLIDAFERSGLAKQGVSFVIAGSKGWNCDDVIGKIEATPGVKWLKNLDSSWLRALYLGARGHFLMSLYEGFGIPVLEAMSCGCPVCYATGSSLGEIAGGCGEEIDPSDAKSVAEAMLRLLEDDSYWKAESEKSVSRACAFTWRNAAKQTLSLYRSLCR